MLELVGLVDLVYKVLTALILVRVLLSWFPGLGWHHPAVKAVHQVTAPILDPIRRLMPPAGGLDLSPIIAVLLLTAVRSLVVELLRMLRL